MIQLPINEKDLDNIIDVMRTKNPQLYAKLWSYKVNNLKKEKE